MNPQRKTRYLRLVKFLGLAATLLLFFSSPVRADESAINSWTTSAAQIDPEIRVESITRNNDLYEVVHLPGGETVEIPVDMDAAEIRQSGLSTADLNAAREESREILELSLRGLLSNDFGGEIVVGEQGEAATLSPVTSNSSNRSFNFFKKFFEFNHEVYKPMPRGLRVSQKARRLLQMTWQFVFVETVHAGIDYYRQMSQAAPRFIEFGIAVDFKLEPQIFVAKFSPTKKIKALSRNYALFFEISYSRALHRVMVRTRFRREKGAGGLGLPAVKAELKFFESDGARSPYKGKAWYPISPPVLSFVLDSSDHYFAQGITIGINSGDLVPGSTLTNTFTEFAQGENLIKFQDIPHQAAEAFSRAARGILPHAKPPVHKVMCSQLFE